MTILTGAFADIADAETMGSVFIYSQKVRPATGAQGGMVTTQRHRIELVDGAFTSPELDPGPVVVEVQAPGFFEEFRFTLPEEGTWRLSEVSDLETEYSPPVIGQAQQAAQEAFEAALSAAGDRRKVERALQRIEDIDPPSGWDDLKNKPTEFPPDTHRHDYGDLDNVPAVFAPDVHTHVSADITDADFGTHANVIIRRNETGHFTVPEPSEDAHPTSRGFVRDAIQQALSDLIDGAPEHLDTLVEIAAQVEENEGGIADLLAAVGEKISKTDAVYSRDSGASVVRRNDTGHIAVPNPNTGEHATPREWVESQIEGTAAATGGALARRDGDGRLSVTTPTANGHAATKQYVDQTVSAADTATRALITALTQRVSELETQYGTLYTAFQDHADVAVISDNIRRITAADNPPGTSPPPDTFNPFELTIVRGEGA